VRLDQAQVSPQQMSMSFLPGEERVLDMEVFAPVKGPLDLYILMDFSYSMNDDLVNLKRMGKKLGELPGCSSQQGLEENPSLCMSQQEWKAIHSPDRDARHAQCVSV